MKSSKRYGVSDLTQYGANIETSSCGDGDTPTGDGDDDTYKQHPIRRRRLC